MKIKKTSSVSSTDMPKPNLLKKNKGKRDYNLKGDLFWNVFNSSNNAILLIRDAEIIDCNKKALELFESKPENIIGKTPFEFSPETQPDGKNSTNKGKKLLEKIIKKGVVNFEWQQKNTSGEQFLAEISAVSFENEGVQYIAATIRDITTYHKEQEELKNYRKNLEKLVDKQIVQLTEFNNELQATNEELDSSNEELQATNEELYATNKELEHTNASLHKEIEEHKRTQAEKAVLEEKLKQFISQSSEAIIIVNDKGVVEDWNETIAQITGISKKKALGKYMWDVTYMMTADPDKAELFRESFKKNTLLFFESIKQGNRKEQVSETLIRHHDSSQRYIHTTLFPIVTNSGNYGGVIISDVTQKKAAEAQLEEYRTELEKLLEQKTERLEQLSVRFNEVYTNSSDAITFMDILDDGKSIKVFDMNPVSQKLFNKTPEQIAHGIYINELMPNIKIDSFTQHILPKLLSGTPVTFTDDRDTGNGYWNSTIYPVKDETGKVYRIAAFSKNVTAEFEKERVSAILNSAIESWPCEFWVCDEEGRCIIQNKASLKYWGDMTGIKPENLDVPDNLKEQTKDIALKALHGEYSSTEFTFERANNDRSVLFNFNPILSKDKVAGFLGLGIDITERKKNEKALYESEQRLQQLLASVTDYTITLKVENDKITAVSHGEGCLTVTGYSPDEFYGNPFLWFNMVHDDDKPLITEWSHKVNRGIEVSPIEHRIIHKNGEVRWVNNTTVIKRNSDGSFAGFDGLITNITERKKAEQALRKSESILKATMESMSDGILIVMSDNKISHVNTRFGQIFSIPEDLEVSLDDTPLLECASQQMINPEEFYNRVVEIYKSESKATDILNFKDGRKIERLSFPLTEECPMKGRVWLFRDVTENKIAEDKLRNSENKFRTIFDNSKDGIILLDRDLKIIDLNKAVIAKSNYPYEKLIGKKAIFFISNDKSAETNLRLESTWEGKTISSFETELKVDELLTIPVEVSSSIILLDDHDALLLIIRDITERKRLEKELLNIVIKTEEQERLHFSQELHDGLGPLLSATKMYVEWLEKPNANIKQTDIIPDIKKLINEASSTVRDISFKLSPHILQNYGVIEALNAYAEKVKASTKINITINTLKYYRINEVVDTVIYRVLCECINNTLKHANARNIEINFNYDEKVAIINYTDDGLGFNIEQAFANRKGVGLLNMQSRLKSINGSILFKSEKGSGSRFEIKINVVPINY